MTSREVIRRIKDLDSEAEVVHRVGSHQKWLLGGGCRVTIPVHTGDIPIGTLHSIERQGEPCLGLKWLTGQKRR